MDNSEKLKQMLEKSLENNNATKMNMELSAKKYDLQKALKHLETEQSVQQDEFNKVKNHVISLSCELPGWQEKEIMAKESLEKLVHQVVNEENKISTIQKELWKRINEWVNKSSQSFQKNISPVENVPEIQENKRAEKVQQLKLDGQLQGLRAYEKYQIRKIEEIRKIKNIVENVDKIPFYK